MTNLDIASEKTKSHSERINIQKFVKGSMLTYIVDLKSVVHISILIILGKTQFQIKGGRLVCRGDIFYVPGKRYE